MRHSPRWFSVLPAFAANLLLACLSPASAGLLVNPGFESGPAMPPAGEIMVPGGGQDLSGWTVGGGGLRIVSDIYWTPFLGARSVSLNQAGAGSIAQTFDTAPGAVYEVSLRMSGEPFTSPAFKHLRVSAAGQTQDFEFDTAPAWHWDMFWAERTFTFTANAATTTLSLTSLDPGTAGPALDEVDVTLRSAGASAPAGELVFAPVVPNPSRGGADLVFTLPAAARANLTVLDAQGREVARVADGSRPAGVHHVRWNAGALAPGLYFARLQAGGRTLVRRVAVVR